MKQCDSNMKFSKCGSHTAVDKGKANLLHLLRSEWNQNISHTSLFWEKGKFFECC